MLKNIISGKTNPKPALNPEELPLPPVTNQQILSYRAGAFQWPSLFSSQQETNVLLIIFEDEFIIGIGLIFRSDKSQWSGNFLRSEEWKVWLGEWKKIYYEMEDESKSNCSYDFFSGILAIKGYGNEPIPDSPSK